jgi:hypothetical protein
MWHISTILTLDVTYVRCFQIRYISQKEELGRKYICLEGKTMERNGSPSTVLKLWIKYVILIVIFIALFFLLDMIPVQLYRKCVSFPAIYSVSSVPSEMKTKRISLYTEFWCIDQYKTVLYIETNISIISLP